MAIKHPFVSLITDVGGPTYVQPTHWNAPLNAPQFTVWDMPFIIGAATAGASLSMPSTAGPTGYEFFDNSGAGLQRQQYDFAYVDNLRMYVGLPSITTNLATAGASAALRFQYMASGFPGSWYSFDATGGSAPFVSTATAHNASIFLASHGLRMSPSMAVSAAAKALPQPLTTRVAAYGGHGSAVVIAQMYVLGS